MINIKMQICGLVIVLMIAFIYSRQKKINLTTERAYMALILLTAVSLIFDILSLVALHFDGIWPTLAVNIPCKVYLCLLIATIMFSFFYVIADVFRYGDSRKKCMTVVSTIYIVFCIAIALLPIYKNTEDFENTYTYGPSVYLTYFCGVALIITTLITVIANAKVINPRRVWSIYIWMGVFLICAVIQFLYKPLLLIGFSGALGVMIMYVLLENPEMNRDRETGLFTEAALLQYMRQFFNRNVDFSVLTVVMKRIHASSANEELIHQYEISIYDYASSLPGVYAFQGTQDELVLVMEQNTDINNVEAMMRSRFAFGWNNDVEMPIRPEYYLMTSGLMLIQAEDYFPFLHYVRENHTDILESDHVILDEKHMAKMRDRELMEHLIRDALHSNRVEVFYQPIYSTEEDNFPSAEALCRIIDVNGKLVPPGKFIEVAEDNGMILELGRRVFEKVCEFIHTGIPAQLNMHYVEINLSVVQCCHPGLAEDYIAIMEKFEVDPMMINLEITETGISDGKIIMMNNIKKLLDYGVTFSLDDFGTGHSNLNYIMEMPVSVVKFDRSMTMAYFKDLKAKFVMDASIKMIQDMDLFIVSEGIETEEQLNVMRELKIDYIQGYYFSKPLPQESFVRFMAENNHVTVMTSRTS